MLGHPVAHSLSPTLHRAAYAALGLDDWQYDAVDVTEEALADFIAGLDGSWAGLSLTMPLKQTVIPLLDHIEPLAQVVGAVNTVLFQGTGGSTMLVGANTDVHGLVAALGEGLSGGPVGTAAVLGAGATASSTLAALAQLGCASPVVYVRALSRAGALMRAAHRMGVTPVFRSLDAAAAEIGRADVVVSTLPPRAADPLAAELAGPSSGRAARCRLRPAAHGPVRRVGGRRGSRGRGRADAAAPGGRAGPAHDGPHRSRRRDGGRPRGPARH